MKKADFDYILELLEKHSGWHLSEEEYFVMDKKITNFIREKGYNYAEDLIAELKMGHKALVSQLVEALAVSYTYFFRDFKVMESLQNVILPNLRDANKNTKNLHILSVGCSSGQEAYSVAMMIKKIFPDLANWNIKIFATDLVSSAVKKAQRGVYSSFEVQTGLNILQILDNFTFDGENWTVNDDLRSITEFRRHNILDGLVTLDSMDVVLCRNVLRYFSKGLQAQIVENIARNQPAGGFLYVGKDEKISGVERFYNAISGFEGLYVVKNKPAEAPAIQKKDTVKVVPVSVNVTVAKNSKPQTVTKIVEKIVEKNAPEKKPALSPKEPQVPQEIEPDDGIPKFIKPKDI